MNTYVERLAAYKREGLPDPKELMRLAQDAEHALLEANAQQTDRAAHGPSSREQRNWARAELKNLARRGPLVVLVCDERLGYARVVAKGVTLRPEDGDGHYITPCAWWFSTNVNAREWLQERGGGLVRSSLWEGDELRFATLINTGGETNDPALCAFVDETRVEQWDLPDGARVRLRVPERLRGKAA